MKSGQLVGVFFLFAVCVAIGYSGYGIFVPRTDVMTPSETISPKAEAEMVEAEMAVPEEPVIDTAAIPVIRSVSKPSYSNKTYNFNVDFYVVTDDSVKLVLLNDLDEVLGYSSDGRFTDVAPSNTPYRIYAENIRTGQRSPIYFVEGCVIPEVPLVDKVSEETLTKMINKGDYPATFSRMWIREHAPHCKYVYTGLSEDELKPDSLQDLCDRVNMESWTCKVKDIKYNDRNEMIKVTIHITK